MSVMHARTFYLIDDDNEDLEFFCEAVSSIDNSIICVKSTSSEQSLDAFRRHDIPIPDLIFLDLNMPMIDGRRFLHEIKQVKAYSQVPVIIYSTSSHPRDIEETLGLGAADFLTKPYSLSVLINNLSGVLTNHCSSLIKN